MLAHAERRRDPASLRRQSVPAALRDYRRRSESSTILASFRQLSARPIRSALTISGIAIGIIALVVVGSLAEQLHRIVSHSTALNRGAIFAIARGSDLSDGNAGSRVERAIGQIRAMHAHNSFRTKALRPSVLEVGTDSMTSLDKSWLRQEIEHLTKGKQLSFALLLCERMVPASERFAREVDFDDSFCRDGLGGAWQYLEKGGGSSNYSEKAGSDHRYRGGWYDANGARGCCRGKDPAQFPR